MPAARSNLLKRLDAFVGEWRTEVSIKGRRVAGGRSVFGWLHDEAFLAEHQEAGEVTGGMGDSRPPVLTGLPAWTTPPTPSFASTPIPAAFTASTR